MEVYGQYNGKLGLICLAIYLIMLYKGRRTFSGKTSPSNNYWFVFIGMSLYSVLGFLEPDTYHYYRIYEEMVVTGDRVYVEPFFYWLALKLPHSYLIWRLSIWGTASLLMACSAKLLKINANVMSFIIPLLFLLQLSVTRGAIGLALMVFCSILFIRSLENKQTGRIVFAVLGIFASVFLHKSMIIFVIILIIAYIIPFNKRTLLISLFLFPFLYAETLHVFKNFSFFEALNEDQVQLITNYQMSEKTEMNLNGIIVTVFEKSLIILLLYNITKRFLVKISTSNAQRFVYKYSFVLVYVSFLFLGQEVSNWISNRTLHAASFVLVFCVTQCFDANLDNNRRTLLERFLVLGFLALTLWKQGSFISSYWE